MTIELQELFVSCEAIAFQIIPYKSCQFLQRSAIEALYFCADFVQLTDSGILHDASENFRYRIEEERSARFVINNRTAST